jgi:RNA polymerase-binding transcription factor DksA
MSTETAVTAFAGEAAQSYRCATCCIAFAIPQSLNERWLSGAHRNVYCPLGHVNVMCVTEVDKVRDELAREKHRTEQAQADAAYQRERKEQEIRRRNAARGQVTRIKNRVKNGVCPACNRTFEDLARHMASKHPHYCEAEKA